MVSFPSWDLFALQADEYRDQVLPAGVPRLAVEAASSFGWERYADATVCIDHFGASAPGEVNLEEFGFTPEHVATRATALLADRRDGEPPWPSPVHRRTASGRLDRTPGKDSR